MVWTFGLIILSATAKFISCTHTYDFLSRVTFSQFFRVACVAGSQGVLSTTLQTRVLLYVVCQLLLKLMQLDNYHNFLSKNFIVIFDISCQTVVSITCIPVDEGGITLIVWRIFRKAVLQQRSFCNAHCNALSGATARLPFLVLISSLYSLWTLDL